MGAGFAAVVFGILFFFPIHNPVAFIVIESPKQIVSGAAARISSHRICRASSVVAAIRTSNPLRRRFLRHCSNVSFISSVENRNLRFRSLQGPLQAEVFVDQHHGNPLAGKTAFHPQVRVADTVFRIAVGADTRYGAGRARTAHDDQARTGGQDSGRVCIWKKFITPPMCARCPMRNARSVACASTAGFHQRS